MGTQGNRVLFFVSDIGMPQRWRPPAPADRSGESRNPETGASLRPSPLARNVRLDSGLRRNDEGDHASRFTNFLINSRSKRERMPALKTRLPCIGTNPGVPTPPSKEAAPPPDSLDVVEGVGRPVSPCPGITWIHSKACTPLAFCVEVADNKRSRLSRPGGCR